jgi:hypothetical protein
LKWSWNFSRLPLKRLDLFNSLGSDGGQIDERVSVLALWTAQKLVGIEHHIGTVPETAANVTHVRVVELRPVVPAADGTHVPPK